MGSKKELKISANVCALTFARPTLLGSLFMHFSQLLHTVSIAGTLVSLAHLLSVYCCAQAAISANSSAIASELRLSTSLLIVAQKDQRIHMTPVKRKMFNASCAYQDRICGKVGCADRNSKNVYIQCGPFLPSSTTSARLVALVFRGETGWSDASLSLTLSLRNRSNALFFLFLLTRFTILSL